MTSILKLGTYNGKPITWSRIGKIDGNSLYLCDEILTNIEYGNAKWHSDGYMMSLPRNVCLDLYNSFSDKEKSLLYNHPELGDPLFLLSDEEYNGLKQEIPKVNDSYWLRSPGDYPFIASYVVPSHETSNGEDGVGYYGVGYDNYGIRPALILRGEN